MMKALPAVAVSTSLLIVGCQSHTTHTASETSSVTVVSTTAPATSTPAERQQLLQRFTQDIWPAVNAFNASFGQGNPGGVNPAYVQFNKIADPGLDTDARNKLHDTTHQLGNVRPIDEPQKGGVRSSDLVAAASHVTVLNPPNATVHVCYTYTAVSYPTDAAHPQYAPAASEADFHLHKTDTWYLNAITNDHVVPGCQAPQA